MIVKYHNTIEDLVAFSQYHCRHSPAVRRNKLTSVLLISAILVGGSLIIDLGPEIKKVTSVTMALVVSILFFFFYEFFFQRVMSGQVRKMYREGDNKGVLGEHELEIKEQGIVERTSVNETHTSWEGVEKIALADDHLIIYISALQAHVIPNRSLTADQRDELATSANRWWREARPDKVRIT